MKPYIKVRGKWKYLYRTVDLAGNTIDFMLSAKRDKRAAKRFFSKALKAPHNSSPRVVNVIRTLLILQLSMS
jgi:transposase-like protein